MPRELVSDIQLEGTPDHPLLRGGDLASPAPSRVPRIDRASVGELQLLDAGCRLAPRPLKGRSAHAAAGTSIEGATAVLLSPDENKCLLVWERGAWGTPGGAVDGGECKAQTVEREISEEVNAEVDLSWGAFYLGGWQAGRARDGLMNDNFSAFVVRLKNEKYKADGQEIQKVRFFPWREVLEQWRAQGKPKDFFWEGAGEAEKCKMNKCERAHSLRAGPTTRPPHPPLPASAAGSL